MPIAKDEKGLYPQDIDGSRYEFTKWGTEDALDALFDIGALIGGPMGAIGENLASAEGMQKNLSLNTIDALMTRIASQLTDNRPMVMRLLRKLCTHQLLCDGRQLNFNVHYKDKLPLIFKVAKANIEVQFESFFAEPGIARAFGVLGNLGGAIMQDSKSEAA